MEFKPGEICRSCREEQEEFNFKERLEELNEELEVLNIEAHELEEQISENISKLLGNL